jgi:hypothetical protein
MADERALREYLGVSSAATPAVGAKASRTLYERFTKGEKMPTLEEVRYPHLSAEEAAAASAAAVASVPPPVATRARGGSVMAALARFGGGSKDVGAERSMRGVSMAGAPPKVEVPTALRTTEGVATEERCAAADPHVLNPCLNRARQSAVSREGYLEKEGGLMKNTWERRFFVLSSGDRR